VTVTFEEAMNIVRMDGKVRRESWWPSRLYVCSSAIDGFYEPLMMHQSKDGPVEYPLALGRPDWFATDWIRVDKNGQKTHDNGDITLPSCTDNIS
jgi:hypothetical protein